MLNFVTGFRSKMHKKLCMCTIFCASVPFGLLTTYRRFIIDLFKECFLYPFNNEPWMNGMVIAVLGQRHFHPHMATTGNAESELRRMGLLEEVS